MRSHAAEYGASAAVASCMRFARVRCANPRLVSRDAKIMALAAQGAASAAARSAVSCMLLLGTRFAKNINLDLFNSEPTLGSCDGAMNHSVAIRAQE